MQSASPVERAAELNVPIQLHIDGQPELIRASIQNVYSGLVELSSPVYLKHNQKAEIVCEGRTIPSLVAFCRRKVSGTYAVAVKIARDASRRAEVRIPADVATKLFVVGSPAALAVRIVDLSPSGLGLELRSPIPVGARVSVDLGHRTALGEIEHCARRVQNYRAGIRLEKLVHSTKGDAMKWTDLNSGSGNLPAVAAFVRSVEERQARSQAIVLSLCRLSAACFA